MQFKSIKQWETKVGLTAYVVAVDVGYYNGYVEIPKEHKLYGVKYRDFDYDFNVHGGVTFTGTTYVDGIDENVWLIGFDCNHAWDNLDVEEMEQYFDGISEEVEEYNRIFRNISSSSIFRDLDYVTAECESLAEQIGEEYGQIN